MARLMRGMNGKVFKWTVEISVSETLVASGFEVTQENLQNALRYMTGHPCEGKTEIKLVKSPSVHDIAIVQGYQCPACRNDLV